MGNEFILTNDDIVKSRIKSRQKKLSFKPIRNYFYFEMLSQFKKASTWSLFILTWLCIILFNVLLPIVGDYDIAAKGMIIGIIATVSILSAITGIIKSVNIFSESETNGIEILLVSKPITRGQILKGRFLFFFFLNFLYSLISTLFILVFSLVFRKYYESFLNITTYVIGNFFGIFLAFAIFGLISSIISLKMSNVGAKILPSLIAFVSYTASLTLSTIGLEKLFLFNEPNNKTINEKIASTNKYDFTSEESSTITNFLNTNKPWTIERNQYQTPKEKLITFKGIDGNPIKYNNKQVYANLEYFYENNVYQKQNEQYRVVGGENLTWNSVNKIFLFPNVVDENHYMLSNQNFSNQNGHLEYFIGNIFIYGYCTDNQHAQKTSVETVYSYNLTWNNRITLFVENNNNLEPLGNRENGFNIDVSDAKIQIMNFLKAYPIFQNTPSGINGNNLTTINLLEKYFNLQVQNILFQKIATMYSDLNYFAGNTLSTILCYINPMSSISNLMGDQNVSMEFGYSDKMGPSLRTKITNFKVVDKDNIFIEPIITPYSYFMISPLASLSFKAIDLAPIWGEVLCWIVLVSLISLGICLIYRKKDFK